MTATLPLDTVASAASAPQRIVACAARSERGARRSHNEDSLLVAAPLLAVADGVGGHARGERASALAIDVMQRSIGGDPRHADPERALREAIDAANAAVHAAGRADRRATTIVAALVLPAAVAIGHAGDSRAYLHRAGRLAALTHDHSLVAALVASGAIDARAARTHPLRSRIARAIGLDATVRPDVTTVATRPGDLLLLCSDGLSDAVDHELIEHLAGCEPDLERLVEQLAAAARRAGGGDDTTIVAARLG